MHLRFGLPKNAAALALATCRGGESELTVEILFHRAETTIVSGCDERLKFEGIHEGFGGNLVMWSSWRGSGCGVLLTKTNYPKVDRFEKQKPQFLFFGDTIRSTEAGLHSLEHAHCGFIHPAREKGAVILIIWHQSSPTPVLSEEQIESTASFFHHLYHILAAA